MLDQGAQVEELEPYEPHENAPWTRSRAAHLLRRCGFDPDEERLRRAVDEGPGKTIDRELARARLPAPEEEIASAYRLSATGNIEPLRAWWIGKILTSDSPLRQRMTLFWHDHFATSNRKVQSPRLMLEQHLALERRGLGSLGDLLLSMTRDPAMLLWLDGNESRRGAANENYARELFELFALGEGNYEETDIKEAARAFTGWAVQQDRAVFRTTRHDAGAKTVFGRTGKFSDEDIVDLCLEQEACARHVPGKLFLDLVGLPATPSVLDELSRSFRRSGHDLAALVERILRSRVFHSDGARRRRVRPPLEFVAGLVRPLEGATDAFAVGRALQAMGQTLFEPPSVEGWKQGRSWIDTTRLLARYRAAERLTGPDSAPGLDADALCRRHRLPSTESAATFVMELLLPEDGSSLGEIVLEEACREPTPGAALRRSAFLVASSPQFQMT